MLLRPALALLLVAGCGGGDDDSSPNGPTTVDGGGGGADAVPPDAAPPPVPEAIVIYNPDVAGSLEVAQHYATFRGLPSGRLCAAAAADPTVLAGDAYPGWLEAVMTCVDAAVAAGDEIDALVPVWGVPYKLAGRIADWFAGSTTPTTVSLDAVLAYGRSGLDLTEPVTNPLYLPGTSSTGTWQPYVPFDDLRDDAGLEYYQVARIDGATVEASMALVDRTAAAEALAADGALAGTVYVDGNRGLPHPASEPWGSYEYGEWNIIGVETVFTALGWYSVVADYHSEEFGTAPAPLTCPDALYYAGWYSFGNYNDVFTWAPGAIGGHLDSCSACDIRGGGDWSARALEEGITATFGAVGEPYVAGMPEYDQFFLYLTQGASVGEAAYLSTRIGAWMMVWVGDPLYRPYP